MILSGREIQAHLGDNIRIDPFKPENLNPNSYNLTLHADIMTYEEVVLDMRKANPHSANDHSRIRHGS